MKKKISLLGLFFLVFFSVGCSTKLKVERLENKTYTDALAGPIYYLGNSQ